MAPTRYVRVEPDHNGQKIVREVLLHDGDIYDIMHADLEWVAEPGTAVVEGWHYNGTAFAAPPALVPPPPGELAVLQKALISMGTVTQADLDAAEMALRLA